MNDKKKCTVADYMRTPAVMAKITTTFQEAVDIMTKENVNSLVIVDADGKVIGILSSWDLVEYVVPDYLEEDKHLAAFESSDTFKVRTRQVADDPIGKFITKRVHTITADSSIMETATTLSEYHVRQMPVVDKEGHPVGYVNCADIKRAIYDVLHYFDANKNNK